MCCPTTVELPEASVDAFFCGLLTPSPKKKVLNSACPELDGKEFCPGSISADPEGRESVTGGDVHSSLPWGWE